ncbi:MAG: MBL fold hydrolase [Desulfuromonas sp.]|nr:MAG: MBL fold hydrolase [Desulfuromonas sp.]
MKITFLGVGSQFSGHELFHSNMIITAESGNRLLIDCGSDIRFTLHEQNLTPADIDAIYISHLHGDHVGGLEWMALNNYFTLKQRRPRLICEQKLIEQLWENSLKGGLECLGDRRMTLNDYFACHPVSLVDGFLWEQIAFKLIRMPHVDGPVCRHDSFGLLITDAAKGAAFISTDTTFQPELLEQISAEADIIFHDCETTKSVSSVHAHYKQLRTLPADIKSKIWLYHYQSGSDYQPERDGFKGFVTKGQEFFF